MILKWLEPQLATLTAAHRAGRMPHAIYIHEAPGAGGEWLADWIGQLLMCTQAAAEAPCGNCGGCKRAASAQHPDIAWVRPIEDSRQIRIEQVRELSAELSLTSHQGGFKVGIVSPADALNRFAANALLKTLEEPSARTVLILVGTQPSWLPATIRSRCQRIRVPAPDRAQAVAWLRDVNGEGDWETVLDALGEAPLLAAEADPASVAQLVSDTRQVLTDAAGGGGDPIAAAERWSRTDTALRLLCFENWLTEHIRTRVAPGAFDVKTAAGVREARAPTGLNTRLMFELLDGVRDLRASLDAPINRSLALESLLRRLAPARMRA